MSYTMALTVFFTVFLGWILKGDCAMGEEFYYGVYLSVGRDADIEVFVNNIPEIEMSVGRQGVVSIPIHWNVLPGMNTVDIVVGSVDYPAKGRKSGVTTGFGEQLEFSGAIEKDYLVRKDDRVSTRVERIIKFEWNALEHVKDHEILSLPFTYRIEFDAPSNIQPPIWAGLKVLTLNNELRNRAFAKIEQLADMLKSKEPAAFVSEMTTVYADAARTWPENGDIKQLKRMDLVSLQRSMDEPDWEVAPVKREEIRFRLVGNGRLLECFGPDNKAVLRTRNAVEESVMYYETLFGEINGNLVVIR